MPKSLNEAHKEVYNSLADEYDARTESLRAVTEASLANLTPQLYLGANVLDIGCGAGLAVEVLRAQGYRADGIELAPAMADVARRRNPAADIVTADYLTTNLGKQYDGIVAFAFIHLFPKDIALIALKKMHTDLKLGGTLLIGTTKSESSSEGYMAKADYEGAPLRYRKNWTQPEFEAALADCSFKITSLQAHTDPYGKTWLDYTVQPQRHSQ